ncbi:ISAzo13 family transposase [Saccharopolyspora hattusasensis]|uniref:ISAzo13 family transposase n=1 Tax=Saccharopolyspora hattusasensis TaxID=1128679 RepID=UPI003D96A96D
MAVRLAELLPRLNERDRRLALGAEAKSWGRGGIAEVHRATGMARSTIKCGMRDLDAVESRGASGRVRARGGGRKKAEDANPELVDALNSLIEPGTRGDPESPLRWTTKSTRNLARELTEMGHSVSHTVVAKILAALGFSLQATRKTLEGTQHPDRDAQFRYINSLAEDFLAAGDPVISVDTKKKELVGRFAQAGREWRPARTPVEVSTYDFPSSAEGKAIPYGVYDIADDSAWVSVGVDHDTSVFAVATIEAWWQQMGQKKYPNARRLLITADGGGSNGSRPWLWKHELARLSAATGLEIAVCRYPPGTSKWNKIEHRLFSQISLNWRGRPLETYQTVVNLIANTTTAAGLTIRCELDPNLYPTKIKLTKQQKESIPITRSEFHGDWNYIIHPAKE